MRHQYFIFTVSITKKAPDQRDFLGDGLYHLGNWQLQKALNPDYSTQALLYHLGNWQVQKA